MMWMPHQRDMIVSDEMTFVQIICDDISSQIRAMLTCNLFAMTMLSQIHAVLTCNLFATTWLSQKLHYCCKKPVVVVKNQIPLFN